MMQSLAEINRRYCEVFDAYTLVLGEGNPRARLVLVGEAPGAQEALLGRPFVGTAGKNLDAFLVAMDLPREAIYITNTVKFRPTRTGKSGRLSNRTPSREEAKVFRPWLMEEIEAVGPAVVATLGNTALHAVTEGKMVIGDVHGRPLSQGDRPYVVFPLYHPASIIYRRELKAVYDEDVQRLKAYLGS